MLETLEKRVTYPCYAMEVISKVRMDGVDLHLMVLMTAGFERSNGLKYENSMVF